MSFDAEQFKSQFPLFAQAANQSLVYVDNAATTQKPQCVIDAITHFYLHQNGNAQRASHRLARAATDMVTRTRELAAEFVGASSADDIIFTSGATEAINIIAYGLADMCCAGDEIVLSVGEHHANLLPWQRVAEQQQCKLIFLPTDNTGYSDITRWQEVVSERTRIVALSAASNVLGGVIDLAILAQIKQRFPKIIIVLDASQIACHMPLQAVDWQCDFLVCSAHKFYGPTGIGLLYAAPALLEIMSPLHVGGEMADQVNLQKSTFVSGVQRFEAGTSSLAAIAGLQACLQFWQAQDRTAMRTHEQQLTTYLHEKLAQCCIANKDLQLITSPENNLGIATIILNHPSLSLSDLALWLDENDIAVRVGHHCAQTLWQTMATLYGADKGLRISLAAYNTADDIDVLISAINRFFSIDDTEPSLPLEDWSDLDWQVLATVKSWQKKYKILLQWGNRIHQNPLIREERFLIKGCESKVWLQHWQESGRHYFLMDSDSNIIKGLSALLLVWFNGKTSEEINAIDITERYQALGLEKHLSASRMNGFLALLRMLKSYV